MQWQRWNKSEYKYEQQQWSDNYFTYLNKSSTADLCFRAHREERPEILYFETSVFLLIYKYDIILVYNKPTRCNSGSIVFINNYKYAVHISDALCFHHQEHYKL